MPYDVCLCVTKVVKTYVLFKNVCLFATQIFERSDIIFWAFFESEKWPKVAKIHTKNEVTNSLVAKSPVSVILGWSGDYPEII